MKPKAPTELKITLTRGRGVSNVQLLFDDRGTPDAAMKLFAQVSEQIAAMDREAREPVGGV